MFGGRRGSDRRGSCWGSGSTGSAAPKKKVKPHKGNSASLKRKSCVVCPKPLKGKSKNCVEHNKLYEAMKYKAKVANTSYSFDKIMADESKARSSILDFERENPPSNSAKL